jgi:hypothetical protein
MGSTPWERQADEGAKPYEAFKIFLDAGSRRSAAAVGRQLGISATLIHRWSSRFDWIERAEQFDRWGDQLRLERNIREAIEMGQRHAEIAKMALEKCRVAIRRLDPAKIKNPALARLLGEASRMEFRARGEPDEDRVASVTINVTMADPVPDVEEGPRGVPK